LWSTHFSILSKLQTNPKITGGGAWWSVVERGGAWWKGGREGGREREKERKREREKETLLVTSYTRIAAAAPL